jgi:hypothetical protein
MSENTIGPGADARPEETVAARGPASALWKLVLLAFGIHVVIALASSPGFLLGQDEASPEAKMAAARKLVEDENFEEAAKLIQTVVDKTPQPPPVFRQAAEMLPQVRMKAVLKAERLRKEKEKQEGAEEKPGTAASPTGQGEKPAGGEKPKVELPTLPEIE